MQQPPTDEQKPLDVVISQETTESGSSIDDSALGANSPPYTASVPHSQTIRRDTIANFSPENNSKAFYLQRAIPRVTPTVSAAATSTTANTTDNVVGSSNSSASTGGVVNGILFSDYKLLKGALNENIDKKALNASKLLQILKLLPFYHHFLEKDSADTFLNLLSLCEDRKVVRLIHYFLSELSTKKNYSSIAELKLIKQVLGKEFSHKDISRRILALKTLSRFCNSNDNAESLDNFLVETIQNVLKTVQEEEAKSKKKTKRIKFPFLRGTDVVRERGLLQYGCFLSIRQRFIQFPSAIFPYLMDGFKCVDSVGCRHAMGAALLCARQYGDNVCEILKHWLKNEKEKDKEKDTSSSSSFSAFKSSTLRGKSRHTNTSTDMVTEGVTLPPVWLLPPSYINNNITINNDSTNVEDFLGRCYVALLASQFAYQNTNTNTNTNNAKTLSSTTLSSPSTSENMQFFFQFLCQGVLDINDSVCFTCIESLSKADWYHLFQAKIPFHISSIYPSSTTPPPSSSSSVYSSSSSPSSSSDTSTSLPISSVPLPAPLTTTATTTSRSSFSEDSSSSSFFLPPFVGSSSQELQVAPNIHDNMNDNKNIGSHFNTTDIGASHQDSTATSQRSSVDNNIHNNNEELLRKSSDRKTVSNADFNNMVNSQQQQQQQQQPPDEDSNKVISFIVMRIVNALQQDIAFNSLLSTATQPVTVTSSTSSSTLTNQESSSFPLPTPASPSFITSTSSSSLLSLSQFSDSVSSSSSLPFVDFSNYEPLSNHCIPSIHQAIRTATALFKQYVLTKDKSSFSPSSSSPSLHHPLHKLGEAVSLLLHHPYDYIRVAALKALIWYANDDDNGQEEKEEEQEERGGEEVPREERIPSYYLDNQLEKEEEEGENNEEEEDTEQQESSDVYHDYYSNPLNELAWNSSNSSYYSTTNAAAQTTTTTTTTTTSHSVEDSHVKRRKRCLYSSYCSYYHSSYLSYIIIKEILKTKLVTSQQQQPNNSSSSSAAPAAASLSASPDSSTSTPPPTTATTTTTNINNEASSSSPSTSALPSSSEAAPLSPSSTPVPSESTLTSPSFDSSSSARNSLTNDETERDNDEDTNDNSTNDNSNKTSQLQQQQQQTQSPVQLQQQQQSQPQAQQQQQQQQQQVSHCDYVLPYFMTEDLLNELHYRIYISLKYNNSDLLSPSIVNSTLHVIYHYLFIDYLSYSLSSASSSFSSLTNSSPSLSHPLVVPSSPSSSFSPSSSSSNVNIILVFSIYYTILTFGSERCRLSLLKHCFTIIDEPPPFNTTDMNTAARSDNSNNINKDSNVVVNNNNSITHNIQKIIYWFLGSYAVYLVGEDKVTSITPTDNSNNEQVQEQNTEDSDGDDSESDDNNDNDNDEDDSNNDGISYNMHAILKRLLSAILESNWEVRLICVFSLSKICFLTRSSYVRLHIYQSLIHLEQYATDLKLKIEISPLLTILDRVFTLQQSLFNIQNILKQHNSSKEDILNLQQEYNFIVEQINLFLISSSSSSSPSSPVSSLVFYSFYPNTSIVNNLELENSQKWHEFESYASTDHNTNIKTSTNSSSKYSRDIISPTIIQTTFLPGW